MTNKRQPRSPYARYGKTPYKYSEAYHRWARAAQGSDEDRAEADAAFRKIFSIPTWVIDPDNGRVLNFPRV